MLAGDATFGESVMTYSKDTPSRRGFDPKASAASLRKKTHPWAWIIALIIALSLVWGLFGRDNLKVDADHSPVPAVSETAAE